MDGTYRFSTISFVVRATFGLIPPLSGMQAETFRDGGLRLKLRRKTSPPTHWFMPPSKSYQY